MITYYKITYYNIYTFDLVPVTLFLYYTYLVTRNLLATSSFFIPDPPNSRMSVTDTQVF